MEPENQFFDRKSIRAFFGKSAKKYELAKDVVAFANAQGGRIALGIEDKDTRPPVDQRLTEENLVELQRWFPSNVVNVNMRAELCHDEERNADYITIEILQSSSLASTPDGRYYIRIGDTSQPLVGEQMSYIASERSAKVWETCTTDIHRKSADKSLVKILIKELRLSDRISPAVKEKSDDELLEYYSLVNGDFLTHLGVLCIGRRIDRATLGSAPSIQYIKYNEYDEKINKICWDTYEQTPMQLVDDIWKGIPDFSESYELAEGLTRRQIPAFDSRVVRELLVNALVHRLYSQAGDIKLEMYPDRLEITNPGRLPLGVTPRNILHTSVRRNNELARIFHDLHLMEREGSGFDLIYDVLTSHGRCLPVVKEEVNAVRVTVSRTIVKSSVINFLEKADQAFHLKRRERILLGLLVQHEDLSARELCEILELSDAAKLQSWFGRLQELGIICQTGRTSSVRYYVAPAILRKNAFLRHTTLKRIAPHRLEALILEDLERHPQSSLAKIHERIGVEIAVGRIRTKLNDLIKQEKVEALGANRWRSYQLK